MSHIEMVTFVRKQEPCKFCREKNRMTFGGGGTVTYKVIPGKKLLRTEFEDSGQVDYVAIVACPKCGRFLTEERKEP